MWHITLPGIKPTIVVLLIMSLGNILGSGFDRPFAFQNNLVMKAADVISTYVYRVGLLNSDFSYGTAIGLFNCLVSLILILLANGLSRKYSETSLF